jgi:lipoate-protein ligase A
METRNKWRLLDSGTRSAISNMALDQVLLESKAKDLSPNTFRFMMFSPPAALLGYHQRLNQEIRVDFCQQNGININRRITGGGALLFDETQIGWEIICSKSFFDIDIKNPYFFELLCQPLIKTLQKVNIPAEYRPRNDIEVNGRKISGTGGTDLGDAFLFQGTLLVDFNVDTMFRALRVPIEKLKFKELESAKERVTCIKWETKILPTTDQLKKMIQQSFSETFNIELIPEGLTPYEENLLEKQEIKFAEASWIDKIKVPFYENNTIYSLHKAKGGIIRITLNVDVTRNRIQTALITGDFFSFPNRAIFDLEAELKNKPAVIENISLLIHDFFEKKHPDYHVLNINPIDFVRAFQKVIEKLSLPTYGISLEEANHIFTINGTFEEILKQKPHHLLLPYCAKSTICGYRNKNECTICGECRTSDAYELGYKKDWSVTTIISFENLIETLQQIKEEGATSFVGSCCEAFYAKHMEELSDVGLPGILIDIDSTTCYDLGKATDAYQGSFENQTVLNFDLIKKVLDAL